MPYTREVAPETKAKISQSNTGKVRTPETKQKISKAKTGVKHTEETKAKISNAIASQWAKVPKKTDNNTEETKPIGFN